MKTLQALLVLSLLVSCNCGTSAQQRATFLANVLSCVKADSENGAVKTAAINALVDGATLNVAGCAQLVCPVISWSIDEVECVANLYAKPPALAPINQPTVTVQAIQAKTVGP
jgi:hypothetical protein